MIIFPVKKIFIRFLILCFWTAIIFLFLYSPKISQYFVTGKSLSVFTFSKFIDVECIKKFEKETGIKLNVNYYDNNDELLVKIRKTGGVGFDVIIPSDYAVELLAKEGLIQKLDKSKINFLDRIDKRFSGFYFDPKNEYSIPYAWEAYKIGYNKVMFKATPINSWKMGFDKAYAPNPIVMNNTPREAILLAAFYLFGSIDNLDDEKLEKIKDLLIKQKQWVEVYTDRRSDYYLSSATCAVAVGSSGEIWRAARQDPNLEFIVPDEGTFMIIDSVVLSAKSKFPDDAYKFINFLYSKEIVDHHIDKYSIFSVLTDVTMDERSTKAAKYTRERLDKVKVDFFRNVLTEDQMNKVWVELKVK